MKLHRRVVCLLAGICLLLGTAALAEGGSVDLDAADSGGTEDLDAVDTGEPEDLDQADTGSTEDLDDAETVAAPLPTPTAVPEVEDADDRAQLEKARARLEAARQRLDAANVAYSQMRARDYPRGAARATILAERASAREAYEDADRTYSELLEQAGY